MPLPTLDTTIGGAASNTYVTVDECEAYLDAKLNSVAWSGADADDKKRALLEAASRMQDLNWIGNRATVTQRLAWPRWGAEKRDSSAWGWGWGYGYNWWGYGDPYLTTEIPQPVKDAQCEYALELLSGFTNSPEAAMESFSADGVSIKLRAQPPAGALPERVNQLLSGLITGNMLVRA